MQNPILRGPSGLSRLRRPDTAPVFLTITTASLLLSGTTYAQKKPAPAPAAAPGTTVPAPVAAAPTVPRKSVNVLIVALDDENAVLSGAPFTGGPATTPLAPDIPLTAVTPTSFGVVEPGATLWRAFAAKPKKPEPSFDPLPEPPSNATPFPPPRVGPGPVKPNTAPGTTAPLPELPSFEATRPSLLAGRSYEAALPLARSLAALGYADTQATAVNGTIIARALGEKRLTAATLDTLRSAMKSLQNATKLPEALRKTSIDVATSRATNAAAAIGQATGYRAVVALYVAPFADGTSPYAIVVSDSTRETGEPIVWGETGGDEATARDTGAATGAALLDKTMGSWTPLGGSSSKALADMHLAKARAATNTTVAQDEITRALALDPTRYDAYILLGDLLAPTDLNGAANAYRRAVEANPKDGATYEKMAIAYANAPIPDWPRALDAGQKAIAVGTDTAALRIAMARAQFGRADLFRAAKRDYRADDAESEAQTYLDRALQLSPDNPDALRLQARAYVTSGRTSEAVQIMGRIIPLFPKDADLQRQYAQALVELGNRKGDAFAAYARLWKMTDKPPSVDEITYTSLTEGFDERVFGLGKSAGRISDGVAAGNIAREAAFLQLARLKSDMTEAEDAINALRPPLGFSAAASTSRQFAASLMGQALEAHQNFLDTGQDVYRTRAAELNRQAVMQLNEARNAT